MEKIFLTVVFLAFFSGNALAGPAQDLSGALAAANKTWAETDSYESLFVKQELDKEGKMDEAEEIFLRYEKPFKIFMGWTNTRKKGLQVLYERGKHGNKLAIHKPGLMLGLAPVVFLPQDSPWVREGSAAYNIEDAGIGTFLNDLTKAVATATEKGQLSVEPIADGYAVTFTGSTKETRAKEYFAYRIETVFDPQSHLPVGMKLYSWENELTGSYDYKNLVLNTQPTPAFLKHINYHLRRVYSSSDR